MENRQPAKTMAWLLVLTFIPILGVILFFFFGQNARKERYIEQHSLDELSRRSMQHFVVQRNLIVPQQHMELVRQFSNQSVALPFCDNEVDVLSDGYAFFPALLEAIQGATDHVHLNTYIFEDDALGRLVADALIDKAKQGVTVRVVFDDVGCWYVSDKIFEYMKAGGVEVHPFLPVRFPAFTSKVNYRNHRKICVVDGKVGFIGGMNIALRYAKGADNRPWRDTHLRIRGRAVYGLQTVFLTDWYFVTRTLIENEKYYPSVESTENGGSLIQIVTSDPTSQWPEMEQGFVRILLEAKRYVYFESPYFLPTESILFALRSCALAGVDVRLVIPEHCDARFVGQASRSFYEEVMEAGVRIFLYQDGFNHSKLLVSDDNLCSCGSVNIDFRSFENNFEANAFIFDNKTALTIKQVMMDDMEKSRELDLEEFRKRPFPIRLWESVVRLFSPLM